MTRSEKLLAALELVSSVRETFKTNRSKCECCGLVQYLDKHEWKLDQALEAAAQRIRKTAEELTLLEHEELLK